MGVRSARRHAHVCRSSRIGEPLIAGAGIGGMAAGIALRRIGWSVSVYERATDLRPVAPAFAMGQRGACPRPAGSQRAASVTAAARRIRGHLYLVRRILRTTQIIQQSRRIGQLGQWSHPVAVALRSALMRGLVAPIQERAITGVIGYRVWGT
jgi:FAD-dependent urate hydroxylase